VILYEDFAITDGNKGAVTRREGGRFQARAAAGASENHCTAEKFDDKYA